MQLADPTAPWALVVAAVAGLVSCLSPCIVPLLPGYLAFIGPGEGPRLGRTASFTLGFATVFTLLGVSAAIAGGALLEHRDLLELGAGIVVALMGLALVSGGVPLPAASRVAGRLREPASAAGAAAVGAGFAVVWAPCIGPALGAILAVAASGGRPGWGALLLLAYSLGMAVPFLLAAVALGRARPLLAALRPHLRALQVAAGVVLIAMGGLMASGTWGAVTARLNGFIA